MNKSIKIVTSTYKDGHKLNIFLNNIKSVNIPHIVYIKNDNLNQNHDPIYRNDINSIEIPNYGRCDYAFLYHIVNNYHNLDDITLFVKCNYYDNEIDLMKHIQLCEEYDYLQSGSHIKYQQWSEGNLGLPEEIHINKDLEEIYLNKDLLDWYFEIYGHNIPLPTIIKGYGHGPCFSVSRNLILRHPVEVYEKLLNKYYPNNISYDTDYSKYNYNSLNDLVIQIGKTYHDYFIRFYPILFGHNVSEEKYKICIL